ncbi:MAG: sulfurtransferase TusA family protein [Bacillota bacterium]|nr:sulfurtransferase TusA family protein [Bacillota bacterium]
MSVIQVDARGCACPEPVLRVKQAMKQEHGVIEVLVDNNVAVENIRRFATGRKYRVSVEEKTGEFALRLEK